MAILLIGQRAGVPDRSFDTSGKTLAEWHHRKSRFSPRGCIRRGLFAAAIVEARSADGAAAHLEGDKVQALRTGSDPCCLQSRCTNEPFRKFDRDPAVQDLDASERFYARLGFGRPDSERPAPGEADSYRMLSNGKGGCLHLTDAVEGWLTPGRNPFGLYLYLESVDAAAREFQQSPEHKPWGMYEFAISDPDETLVRIGWPSRLRGGAR